jgi:hypothetical protein
LIRLGHRGDGDAALFKNDTVGTTCSYEVIVKITGPGQRSSIAVASVADSFMPGGHCHGRITVQEYSSREGLVKNTGPTDGFRPKV